MAVQDQIPYNKHTGNGVTTVFAYGYLLLLSADLKVYLDGVLQVSGYTVSGVGNPTGGTVTFSTAPANGVIVLLQRDIPLERLTDYQDAGDLLADTLNRDFDRLWMAIQGESDINTRQLTLPQGTTVDADLPAPGAAQVLRVNAAADGFEWATVDPATSITLPLSVAQGGTSATTAAGARTALGLGTAAVANTGTASGNVPALDANGKLAASVQDSDFASFTSAPSAGSLLFALNAGEYLDFFVNGVRQRVLLTSSPSLTLPSGSTLGTTSAAVSRIWLVAMYNGGTPELAAINTWNGTDIFEILPNDLITTVAVGAGSASAHTWYSTTLRTAQAINILGYVEVINTAGTWATLSALIGYGSGVPLPGQVIAKRRTVLSSVVSITATTPARDNSIPQITEGTQVVAQALTARSALNMIEVDAFVQGSGSAALVASIALFWGTGNDAIAAAGIGAVGGSGNVGNANIRARALAGSTSSQTAQIRLGVSGSTFAVNADSAGTRTYGGVDATSIEVREVMR